MSYDDEAFRAALISALEGLPVQQPTPAQYAVRRRNHARLLRYGLIDETEQDPAARAAYLGLELPPVDSNHEAPGSEPGGSASSPRGHQPGPARRTSTASGQPERDQPTEIPRRRVLIHERDAEDRCPAEWAEQDTQAPAEVRHECNRHRTHADAGRPHVCICGLVEEL